MDRPDDIMLPAGTPWIQDGATQTLCRALMAGGEPVFFVGGCVRDALLGIPGADVDLSTPMRPVDVTRLGEAAGLKVVPTGIDHGTVTVVVDGRGFEITTFRKDVETDGRRAVVSFSRDMAEDARRRDFTLNALYATPQGLVLDPLGQGVSDCLTRRIRFIEDAGTRIREDYLRILRYFRFHAWYADPTEGFDTEALDAISQNSHGLETLSAERIGAEMLRLLAAPNPAPALAVMRQTGCLAHILPGADDRLLAPVVHLEDSIGLTAEPLLRLAAIGGEEPSLRLRLSRSDARKLDRISTTGFGAQPLAEVAYRDGSAVACAAAVLRAAVAGTEIPADALANINRGAAAAFPVKAKDLMPAFEGKALGDRLAVLEQRWIDSGFRLTREDLMTGD